MKYILTLSSETLDINGNTHLTSEQLEILLHQVYKGDPGAGVPTGGQTGQMLRKHSATDYDTEWADNEALVSGYFYNGVFYADSEHTVALTGREKIIYVNQGVEGKDLYMYSGSSYLRVSNSALTKEQADLLYADKQHTHVMSDITDVEFMTAQQINQILNQ